MLKRYEIITRSIPKGSLMKKLQEYANKGFALVQVQVAGDNFQIYMQRVKEEDEE